MTLLTCGLNHKTAPLAIREKVSFSDEILMESLNDLLADGNIKEAAILSTCNRTEIYCTSDHSMFLIDWLAKRNQLKATHLEPHVYLHHADQAMRHMMRVACGLDSMVLGEPQILGQMKSAYSMAREAGAIGPELGKIFPCIFATSKKVRTETTIGFNPVSLASAAVDLVKRIFADFSKLTPLFIGAGETIELVGKYFHDHSIKNIVVANRNLENAKRLAQLLEGHSLALEEVPSYLAQVDIVISATASPIPILDKLHVEHALKIRKHRPILFIDMAVPRDIDPSIAELADVFLYNMDDLQRIIEKSLMQRQHAAIEAEQIIELEVLHFLREQRLQEVTATIREFRKHALQHCEQEILYAQRALMNGHEPQKLIETMAYNLMNKILHEPTLALRQFAYDEQSEKLALMRELLDIKE